MPEEDCEEVFEAVDTNADGYVSLSRLLHALVDVSPEALLWELRCRLLRCDIRHHNSQKALDLVRWPQHGWQSKSTKLKRRTSRRLQQCCACACSDAPDASEVGSQPTILASDAPVVEPTDIPGIDADIEVLVSEDAERKKVRLTSFHLSRGDWLKFCTSICLTLLEAERLFEVLADDTGSVDLRAMFETLRLTVTPDVSLENFATKVLVRFESFSIAFKTFSGQDGVDSENGSALSYLGWERFRALAVDLDVNDQNAAQLWDMLTGEEARGRAQQMGDEAHESHDECGMYGSRGLSEAAFVRELSLWAPHTAIEHLTSQLCERFGNLAEGRRALARRLPVTDDVSADDLDSILQAAGIRGCDAKRAVSTVACRNDGHVSLETLFDTMQASKGGGSALIRRADCAHCAVRNETWPLWQQLHTVKKDLHCPEGRRTLSEKACVPITPTASSTLSGVCAAITPCAHGRPGASDEPRLSSSPARQAQQPGCRRFAISSPCSTSKDMKLAEDSKFEEAVQSAIRLADSRRSRSVLHTAKRQLLGLEEHRAARATASGAVTPSRHTCGGSTPTRPGTASGTGRLPSFRCSTPPKPRQSGFGSGASPGSAVWKSPTPEIIPTFTLVEA